MRIALTVILITFLAACGSKQEMSPEMIIAGENSRIWTSSDAQDETMRFYSNGTFSMQSASDVANGTWSYEVAGPTLKLVFDGDDHSENFEVSDISNNQMTLVAGDGSTMTLKGE
jgi:outer membrane biogenesis lipoprotein LolB